MIQLHDKTGSASGRYLVVSQRTLQWFGTVQAMSVEFNVLDHETQLFDALTADLYDVVFIDAAAITVDIPWLVNELKNRFRTTGVVVIIGDDDPDVRTQALGAGADDIVEDDILATAILPRLQILLRLEFLGISLKT